MLQGSAEWLEWRRQGIGSSEVPVLMGESDYSTPSAIFRIKRGIDPEQVSNWAMQRGVEAEPRIRALYELQEGIDCPPVTVEHAEYPFLRASLDGWEPGLELVVEFKYPGKEKHQEALQGRVPACYRGQRQYQLAVTGAKEAHYVSFDGVGIAIVKVFRDEEYIARMLQVVKEFWERVVNNDPPPLTENDFLTLDSPEDVKVFTEWKAAKLIHMQFEDLLERCRIRTGTDALVVLKEEAKKAERSLEFYRSRVIERAVHPRIHCAGVQMIRVKRKSGEAYDIRPKESA